MAYYEAGGASWRLEGMRDLEAQLLELGQTFGFKKVNNRILKKAMDQAMWPVKSAMERAAPVQPSPRRSPVPPPLKISVVSSVGKVTGRDKRSPLVTPHTVAIARVGVLSSKKLKAQEFGTDVQTGQPFIRVSLERNIQVVQDRLIDGLKGLLILFQRTEKNRKTYRTKVD